MFSKFLRPLSTALPLLARGAPLVPRRAPQPRALYSDLIPPSQYDMPIPKRLHLGYAMRVYWEIIPLVFVTALACSFSVMATLWSFVHKVDCSYSSHTDKATISRTMDLRNPEIHKMRVINQRYEPWPEMQDVLDKMTMAEKRALARVQTCGHP